MIQELKNHLHQVLRFSENSLLRTKQEAEKQQKADFRASQARVATVQQEILVLQSQFHRDSRAWWAAVHGVAQSRIQLKRLSSSSSHMLKVHPCPSPTPGVHSDSCPLSQ